MRAAEIGRRTFYQLNTDGGIVAEDGQAQGEGSIGVVLRDPNGSVVHEISTRIGWVQDHHVAEYRALIAGLRLALGHGVDDIRVFVDSQVVVNQLLGASRVRNGELKRLCVQALELLDKFLHYELSWISRTRNEEADLLAARALGR